MAGQADILVNIAKSIAPVENLVRGGAYVIGCAFLFKAIYTLKVYGESKTMMSNSASIKEPILYLIVGAALIYFPTTLKVIMQTTFTYDTVLSYAPVDSQNGTIDTLFGAGSAIGRPLTMLIKLIGLVAFVRGWVLIAKSAQGQPPGGAGKGLMHVFGGILAMNIVGTMTVINNTIYG